jgi:hypothetical protein
MGFWKFREPWLYYAGIGSRIFFLEKHGDNISGPVRSLTLL